MILLMFDIGLSHFHGNNHGRRKQTIAALKIAVLGMLLPFIGGVLAGNSVHAELAPQTDRLLFNVFMGTALAVSALPVIVRIIEDLKMLHRYHSSRHHRRYSYRCDRLGNFGFGQRICCG